MRSLLFSRTSNRTRWLLAAGLDVPCLHAMLAYRPVVPRSGGVVMTSDGNRETMRAAPPVGTRTSKEVIAETLEWICSEASEHAGCHHPAIIDVERTAIAATKQAIQKALVTLPKTELVALGRELWGIIDNRNFEADQAEKDWET